MSVMDAREQARTRQVDGKVGADLSEGFLTFVLQNLHWHIRGPIAQLKE